MIPALTALGLAMASDGSEERRVKILSDAEIKALYTLGKLCVLKYRNNLEPFTGKMLTMDLRQAEREANQYVQELEDKLSRYRYVLVEDGRPWDQYKRNAQGYATTSGGYSDRSVTVVGDVSEFRNIGSRKLEDEQVRFKVLPFTSYFNVFVQMQLTNPLIGYFWIEPGGYVEVEVARFYGSDKAWKR